MQNFRRDVNQLQLLPTWRQKPLKAPVLVLKSSGYTRSVLHGGNKFYFRALVMIQQIQMPLKAQNSLRMALLLLIFASGSTASQTLTATQNDKITTTDISSPAKVSPPLIDPAKELTGPAIVSALQKGGYNLYMRHGAASIGQDSSTLPQTPRWWEDCNLQRNLADEGREQAHKVGVALRQLNVPIDGVKTSQFCRTRDTAYAMGFNAIEIVEDLNHPIGQRVGFDVNAARFKLLATPPPPGKNVLMISHTHSSARTEERAMSQLQEAEIVIYLPNGKGGAEPVSRVAAGDWEALLTLAAATAAAAK
jgi:phosphohistidine phosphatase SixA